MRSGRRPAAKADQGVAGHLRPEVAIGEQDSLDAGEVELRAVQAVASGDPVVDLLQGEAGAERPRRSLVAEDARIAGQGRPGIGEPVAVVGIGGVVRAEDLGQGLRRKDPRRHGARVGAPVAGGSRTVEDRQALGAPQGPGQLRDRAGLRLGVGHMGQGADVAVIGFPRGVDGRGVEPGGLEPGQGGGQLADAAGLVHLQVLVGRPQSGAGVADGVGPLGGPGRGRGPGVLDDLAEPRAVEGAADRRQPRRGLHLDGDLCAGHGYGPALEDVGCGVLRIEGQLEQAEPAGRGDRVGPGDPAVVADADGGAVLQAGADDVELARKDHVHPREAVDAVPGIVRIAEEDAAATLCHLAAQGIGVAALPLRDRRALRGRLQARQVRRAGRGGGDDSRHECGLLGRDHRAPVVHLVVGAHPGRAPAAGVREVGDPDVPDIAVDPGDEAAGEGARLRRRLPAGGHQGVQAAGLDQVLVVEVADDVGVLLARPEVAGPLGVHRHLPLGEVAEIVLGGGIARAVAEPAVVAGDDVRRAVGGADHLRPVFRLGRRRRKREKGRQKPRRHHSPHDRPPAVPRRLEGGPAGRQTLSHRGAEPDRAMGQAPAAGRSSRAGHIAARLGRDVVRRTAPQASSLTKLSTECQLWNTRSSPMRKRAV